MDEQTLAEIEARTLAATSGPWNTWRGDNWGYPQWNSAPADKLWNVDQANGTRWVARKVWDKTDAEFIAHARTDIPNLIAALRTAQSQLAQEREEVRVLEGVIRKTIDDVEFLTCVDDVSDAVQRVTVKRMREALSAADKGGSSLPTER